MKNMSYREYHKGKLRILTRSNEETINYIREHNIQDIIKENDFSDGEIDFDTNSSKYIILHKDCIYSGKGCQHMLCEYIEHEELKSVGNYCTKVKRIGKDEYELILLKVYTNLTNIDNFFLIIFNDILYFDIII